MDLSVELLKLFDVDGDGDGDGGEDRLSALPDDLLISILVLVDDAAAAARTSILATRWRRLWAFLPELSFYHIEHHRIGAALAAHEAPDLSSLFVRTEDASPESVSAWLPIAARKVSGDLHLSGAREADNEERGAIDLPCFEKATGIVLYLGFLGLALPPSGVFARLKDLYLVNIQLHGQSGLGDLLSSQRCPSLRGLLVGNVRGLDSFNIHSDSLLDMDLSALEHLQQLTVMAPALETLTVRRCFADPLNPDLSVANISAPQLTMLYWKNVHDPSSIQFDKMTHLEKLVIEIFVLEGEEEAAEHKQYCMTFLRRFGHIHTLDIQISYPPEICTGPYLMDGVPRLPNITMLKLRIMAYGHSFGASSFDLLRRCTGVKKLNISFMLESQLEVETPCPSGCICYQPANWRTEELVLNFLEEINIFGMRGTEHEVALVQQLSHWATVLKRMKIILHKSITESKGEELSQLLLSFSRPDIYMDIRLFSQLLRPDIYMFINMSVP